MVVFCAGTTGFNLTFDARFVWMRQKRIQGSHFANLLQASQANQLMIERRLDPCMSEVFPWADIPRAHTKMLRTTSTSPATWPCWCNAKRRACARSKTCSRRRPWKPQMSADRRRCSEAEMLGIANSGHLRLSAFVCG